MTYIPHDQNEIYFGFRAFTEVFPSIQNSKQVRFPLQWTPTTPWIPREWGQRRGSVAIEVPLLSPLHTRPVTIHYHQRRLTATLSAFIRLLCIFMSPPQLDYSACVTPASRPDMTLLTSHLTSFTDLPAPLFLSLQLSLLLLPLFLYSIPQTILPSLSLSSPLTLYSLTVGSVYVTFLLSVLLFPPFLPVSYPLILVHPTPFIQRFIPPSR